MNPRPNRLKLFRWLPDSWLLCTGPSTDRVLYLTFDDGPNEGFTDRILDVLAENQAKATFFLLGEQIEQHPDLVRRLVAEGHALGNHSYNHPRFTRIPHAEQMEQIARTEALLGKFDGKSAHRFRPPSGKFPLSLLLHLATHRGGMTYWSYDSLDYQNMPTARMMEIMRAQPPRAGDVILMHDESDATVEMLAVMLPEWRKAGFVFRALPELDRA